MKRPIPLPNNVTMSDSLYSGHSGLAGADAQVGPTLYAGRTSDAAQATGPNVSLGGPKDRFSSMRGSSVHVGGIKEF